MRVAFVTPDKLGPRMAGPAIRAYELSRVLARHHAVTLASPLTPDLSEPGLEVLHLPDRAAVRALLGRVDLVIVQGLITERFPDLLETALPLVVDLYDPFFLEVPQTLRGKPEERVEAAYRRSVEGIQAQLGRGDFFLVSSERQQDLYLGMMISFGRLRGTDLDQVRRLDALFGIVPFGHPAEPPPLPAKLRGICSGIPDDAFLVLWPGGLWDWLDPDLLLDAISVLWKAHPRVRLLFPGDRHPNPEIPASNLVDRLKDRAKRLGVEEALVWYSWVEYSARGAFYAAADVAVCLAAESLEGRYAMRSRLLDCLWVGVPVITNEEGPFGAEVVGRDPADLLAALTRRVTGDGPEERRPSTVSKAWTWEAGAGALIEFCDHPRRTLPQRWTRPSRLVSLIARIARRLRRGAT